MQKLSGQEALSTTKQKGDAAEDRALRHLQAHGLQLVQRNYRTPGRGGGEIDLIVTDTFTKRRRIVFAARYFVLKLAKEPPCRFDVVAIEGDALTWYKAAFDAQ